MKGIELWGLIREYVQAEVHYQTLPKILGGGSRNRDKAAEQVSRTETAVREAFEKIWG